LLHEELQAAVNGYEEAVVLKCLQPITLKTPETGTRLRGRIERI
jgi:hypothetical protein